MRAAISPFKPHSGRSKVRLRSLLFLKQTRSLFKAAKLNYCHIPTFSSVAQKNKTSWKRIPANSLQALTSAIRNYHKHHNGPLSLEQNLRNQIINCRQM